MQNVNQTGNTKIVLVILAVLVVILGLYWWNGKKAAPTPSATPQVESGIQSPNDLMSASDDLDKTDVDSTIDSELSQNDTDASSF